MSYRNLKQVSSHAFTDLLNILTVASSAGKDKSGVFKHDAQH